MIESGKFYKTATERNAIRVYRKKYCKRREKSALIGRIEKGFMEHVSVRALLVISNRTQMKKGLSKRGKILVSITDIQGKMELQENLDPVPHNWDQSLSSFFSFASSMMPVFSNKFSPHSCTLPGSGPVEWRALFPGGSHISPRIPVIGLNTLLALHLVTCFASEHMS